MSYLDYPYELYIENRNEKEHYFISFVDVNREKITVEISQSLYLEFETFRKADKRNENFWDRHIEQNTMTDEALYNRTKNIPSSVEVIVSEHLLQEEFWLAVNHLPEKQRRRFLLHYEHGLTFERIALLEGCSKTEVKQAIDKAKDEIRKKVLHSRFFCLCYWTGTYLDNQISIHQIHSRCCRDERQPVNQVNQKLC